LQTSAELDLEGSDEKLLVLFDTSAALAFVDAESPFHEQVWALASQSRRGLAGHALFEFLSVLTRLPMPRRLSGADALRLVRSEFQDNRFLPAEVSDRLADEFTRAGVVGGMVYDGLVGACASHHRLPLLTCDARAETTYQALRVDYRLVSTRGL